MKKKWQNYLYKKHLDEGEEILEIVHRHWFILKMKCWKATTFGIFPPIIIWFFYPGFWPVLLCWLVVGITAYIIKFIEWYFDCLLITNLGIVDIERRGLFDNASKKIEYHTIDGISYEIKGMVPTLLNYGDIVIDKMGSGIRINLSDAPNPAKINRKILEYQEEYVKDKMFTDHEALKGMLSEMIATHVKQHGGYKGATKKE